MIMKKLYWQKKAAKLIKNEYGSEEAFCEEIGKSQGWLNHKINGRRKSSYDDIELIAKGLKLSISELITPEDEYIIIKKDPEKAKENLILEIQEVAATYIAEGKDKELQDLIDQSVGRLNRLKKE